MPAEQPACSGIVDKIGKEDAEIKHEVFGSQSLLRQRVSAPDHAAAMTEIISLLTSPEHGVVKSVEEIKMVGHRIVHGGETFSRSVEINETVKQKIKSLFLLAPLHNPVNYSCLEQAEKAFKGARHIAVFDTAFHQSLQEHVYRYAIPANFYAEQAIRVYGFHGTSHRYVSQKAALLLKNPDAKLISVHLGNGCSITAIKNGRSIDTSMGFGPLAGLVMGTRSGDIDPSVIFQLLDTGEFTTQQVNDLLNKKSGLMGLAGTNDMREVRQKIQQGDQNAKLGVDIYVYRIKKYIGAFCAALNGVDAIIFTAGVGENDENIRAQVCSDMDFVGIRIDPEKNRLPNGITREIQAGESRIKILVIPTNEELEIANECYALA